MGGLRSIRQGSGFRCTHTGGSGIRSRTKGERRIGSCRCWPDHDLWVGYLGGEFQVFADGKRHVIRPADKQPPLVVPGATVALARVPMSFKVKMPEGKPIYLVGLDEGEPYRVRVNRSRFRDVRAARGGIIPLRT